MISKPQTAVRAYVALGANLGDRAAMIRRAIELLQEVPGITIAKVSSLIETPAEGGPADSPPYLNGAAAIDTTLSPRQVLDALLSIERKLGRTRRTRWEPRTIDLDLLLYGDQIIDEPELTVPHPRLAERIFVLTPLAEIAPNVLHPVLKKTIAELRAANTVL